MLISDPESWFSSVPTVKRAVLFLIEGWLSIEQGVKSEKDELLSRDRQTATALAKAFKKKTQKKGPQGFSSPCLDQHIDLGAGASLSTVIDPPPVPDPEPEGSRSRSGRLRTFPSRYKDFLPVQTMLQTNGARADRLDHTWTLTSYIP